MRDDRKRLFYERRHHNHKPYRVISAPFIFETTRRVMKVETEFWRRKIHFLSVLHDSSFRRRSSFPRISKQEKEIKREALSFFSGSLFSSLKCLCPFHWKEVYSRKNNFFESKASLVKSEERLWCNFLLKCKHKQTTHERRRKGHKTTTKKEKKKGHYEVKKGYKRNLGTSKGTNYSRRRTALLFFFTRGIDSRLATPKRKWMCVQK